MGRFSKLIISIVIILCLGVGGYYLITKNNSFAVKILGDGVVSKINKAINNNTDLSQNKPASNEIVGLFSSKVGDVFSTSKDFVVDQTKKLSKNILEKTQETGRLLLSKSEQVIENKIGISARSDSFIQNDESVIVGMSPIVHSNFSYLVKNNQLVNFILKPTMIDDLNGNFDCYIDWGDGKNQKFTNLSKESIEKFSHLWTEKGDYVILFKIISGNKTKEFLERIYVSQ